MPEMVDVKAPAVESKEPAAPAEKVEAKSNDKSVGELLGKDAAPKEEPKMIPESALIEVKKENKELWKELKKTQTLIADGASKKEVAANIKQIAEKYDVKEDFLSELAQAIRAQDEADIDERVASKLKPIEDQAKAANIEKIFSEHYDRTLSQMPEYKDVVDRETVKALTLLPENANKTFAQILEKAYGHLVQGKRTIESARPRGGKESPEIDYAKASSDPAYFKEIMSDPQRRKEYNANLHKRLRL